MPSGVSNAGGPPRPGAPPLGGRNRDQRPSPSLGSAHFWLTLPHDEATGTRKAEWAKQNEASPGREQQTQNSAQFLPTLSVKKRSIWAEGGAPHTRRLLFPLPINAPYVITHSAHLSRPGDTPTLAGAFHTRPELTPPRPRSPAPWESPPLAARQDGIRTCARMRPRPRPRPRSRPRPRPVFRAKPAGPRSVTSR